MEIFGKEINLELDKQKSKLLILIGTCIGVFFLIYFLIISPIRRVFNKKDELVRIEQLKMSTDQNLRLFEKRYDKIEAERGNQSYRLEELLQKFQDHSLKDEARLKQMVQDILDHLNIQLLEIGKTETEIIEGNTEYKKKMIPYRIMGDGRDVALFFFYLENGKALLTLKGSRLEMINKLFTDVEGSNGAIEVKFKLGYYDITTEKKEEGNEE